MKFRKQKKDCSAMDASIGVNLRVTAHSNQGGRKYMEDMFCVAYQPTSDEKDLLYAYFGIFDGHGGREAALYAKNHLMDHIVSQKNFWSDEDELVLRAIKDGFISVHHAMWRELDKWPKTQSGLPSTSGTTASVAFVRRGKLYIGHVGDSGIVLGYKDEDSDYWKSKQLTKDHKPENPSEYDRIVEAGGKVVSKSGVPRVVWNRPRIGHKGPVRRSTMIDEIPFLAVARSLGDLWSYNSEQDEFVVSPEPDTSVIEIDVNSHRCLILGSDGLWNMLSCQDAVNSVFYAEKSNEHQHILAAQQGNAADAAKNWMNPSKRLVDRALDRWYGNNLRADNTSVVTVVIDPPGPPKKPPNPTLSPQYKPIYSRYVHTSPNRHHVSPNRHAESSEVPPRLAKMPVKPSQARAGGSLVGGIPQPGRPVGRRRGPGSKISSKTSRVFYRHPNQDRIPSSQSQAESIDDREPDVQINEVSSSCESKRSGADSKNISGHSSADLRRQGRGKQASTKLRDEPPAALPTKRSSRQSEDERAPVRKVMRITPEPTSSTSQKQPSIKRPGLTDLTGGQNVGRLRSRSNNGKIIKPSRLKLGSATKDKEEDAEKLKGNILLSLTSPRSTRQGSPVPSLSISDLLTDSSSDNNWFPTTSTTTTALERLTMSTSKLLEANVGKRGRPPKKSLEPQATTSNDGDDTTDLLDTSLPAEYTCLATPTNQMGSPKPGSSKVTRAKSAARPQGVGFGKRAMKITRSVKVRTSPEKKKLASSITLTVKKSMRSLKLSKGRVTRSMQQKK